LHGIAFDIFRELSAACKYWACCVVYVIAAEKMIERVYKRQNKFNPQLSISSLACLTV